MKTHEQIFKEQYKKFSKERYGVNWANMEDVINSPNHKLVLSCMDKNEKQYLKILKDLKKPLANIMNPDFDFGVAFEQLKEFKQKYKL